MKAPQVTAGVYRHYKGKMYFVLGVSMHTERDEICVVYRPLYETAWPQLMHRPAAMFFENVEVDGQLVARFELISS